MTSEKSSFVQSLPSEVYETLPDSVFTYIRYLERTIQQLQEQNQQLHNRVAELEDRLAKNSSNSSKPPSSDGLKKKKRKPKSQRGKSGKKPGGQRGHSGKGLSQVENPNFVVTHTPINCHECGSSLSEVCGSCVEKRQVFEIPQPKVEITEHRAEEKQCPCCGAKNRAAFPEDVRGPVQYGERVQALAAYFAHQHFIPVDRVCQILEDVFGTPLSSGTCSNIDEKLFQKLEIFEENLKVHLLASRTLHFDETGMRCEKKLYWVHVASSEAATLYKIHAKRGKEAIEDANILPRFQGTAIHDHWTPYFSYEQVRHGLCNAHHLRELTFVHEEKKEEWAKNMKDLLIFAKNKVEEHLEQGALPSEILLQINKTYSQILVDGLAYHSNLPPMPKNKRGKQKQREGKNFLDRLEGKRECVLLFMNDFSVPFTNNQGEQDIRMVKVKQKVSGCFRTHKGGEIFCRVRSYISTARKQGWNIWDALANAIRGSPYLLTGNQPTTLETIAA